VIKIFIDTDICLDVLLRREPFFGDSAALLDWAEKNPGQASVSWHGLANLHYLSDEGGEGFIRELLEFCVLPPCGSSEMMHALDLGFTDLEDAMQAVAAIRFGAQLIVTRNVKDFRRSPIQAILPRNILSHLP
jgi:predicted nucleic acid-binding protein